MQGKGRVELEVQGCVAAVDIERVGARETIPGPGDLDRPQPAVREVEQDRGGVVDVASLALALSQQHPTRGGLNGKPNWEEPPVHQDLIAFDMTVTAGGEKIIDEGFLMAL